MFKFTQLTRLSDALPLAASMDNNMDGQAYDRYKLQAKGIMKEFASQPPRDRLFTIDTGDFSFHILIENGVVITTLCEQKAPASAAFSFLEDLSKEFNTLYGNEVAKCERPYQFIKFDTFLQKTKKVYSDMRSSRTYGRLPSHQAINHMHISKLLATEAPPSQPSNKPNKLTLIIAGSGALLVVLLILLFVLLK